MTKKIGMIFVLLLMWNDIVPRETKIIKNEKVNGNNSYKRADGNTYT